MQIRNSVTVFLMLLVSCIGYAQKVSVDWGPEIEEPKKTGVDGIIGSAGDKFYVHRAKDNGKSHYIEVYDRSNKLISSNEIILKEKTFKDVNFETIGLIDGQLILFYSFYNKKIDKNFAFGNKISEKGELIGEPYKVDEIESEKKHNAGNFSFITSNDSTKILIFRNDPFEKHASEKFNIKIIDKNLKTVWEKHVTMPFQDEDFSMSDYVVANDGKMYLLAKFQHGARTKKEGKPTYKYFIYAYSGNEAKPVQYEISLGDKFISDIGFRIDKDKNLLVAGFYSNKNAEDLAGTCFLKVNGTTKAVMSKSIKEFTTDFLTNFMSEKKAEKKKRELEKFEIRDILVREDGGAIIIAEEAYIEVRTYTSTSSSGFTTTTTTYIYHNNHIIALNINPDGTLKWEAVVPKEQVSTDGGYYSSFAMAVYKDKIFFIYNDKEDNLKVSDNRKLKPVTNFKKAIAVLAVVDGNGGVTRQELFSNKDNNVILRPKIHLQTKKNEIQLYAEKKKNYKFGTISFE